MDRRTFLGIGVLAATPGRAAEASQLLELSQRPTNYESPRAVFAQRITPLDQFYVRSHFDAPRVEVATWRLRVGGLVDAPLALSLADLQAMPQTTVEAVLQCAGNGRALFRPRMPGVQWQRGAMGNATWGGVRLRDVLARARPRPEVKHAHLRGTDGPMMPSTPSFIRAVPTSKAMHEDTLIALTMNGQPLPPLHGAPARLVMPGWVADGWTKWVQDITLSDVEPEGFFYQTAYRFPTSPVPPGAAVPPAQMGPMSTLNVKSIIASPDGAAPLRLGRHDVTGVAFSGGASIRRVELRVNDGPWRKAELGGPATPYGFRVFRGSFEAKAPGRYRLACRAFDDEGRGQPDEPAWNPSGYLYNAVDPLDVDVVA